MKYRYSSVKRAIEALLFVAVLALGWRYPCLAYCLLLNVAVGLIGALRHGGRHGCGNFCPRGAFKDFLKKRLRKSNRRRERISRSILSFRISGCRI